MSRKHGYVVAAIAVIIATLAGGRYSWNFSRDTRKSDQVRATTFASAYTRSESKDGFHMPNSADKVGLKISITPPTASQKNPIVKVRLKIKKGWHVNANPASLQFLIPTSVRATINHTRAKLDVSYPLGRDRNIKLDGKSILVYDNNTTLKASIPASTLTRAVPLGFSHKPSQCCRKSPIAAPGAREPRWSA